MEKWLALLLSILITIGFSSVANASDVEIGSIVEYGCFFQNSNEYMQPIEWIVLTENNGEVLLLSRYGLLENPYYSSWDEPVRWCNSYAQALLNSEFLIVFSDQELASIIQHEHEGSVDYVFLLSEDEYKAYCTTEDTKLCFPTAISGVIGGGIESIYEGYAIDSHCDWWLRNVVDIKPDSEWGWDMVYAPTVGYYGELSSAYILDGVYVALRPAIWVDASSIRK